MCYVLAGGEGLMERRHMEPHVCHVLTPITQSHPHAREARVSDGGRDQGEFVKSRLGKAAYESCQVSHFLPPLVLKFHDDAMVEARRRVACLWGAQGKRRELGE